MKKFTFFLMLALFAVSVNAQSLSIGVTGGLSTMQSPDAFTNDISSDGMGLSSAPFYGVKAKFGLPILPLTITGQITYSKFTGEGDLTYLGYDVHATTEQSILMLAAGAEWSLIPGPLAPYLGVDLFYTNYGEAKFNSSYAGYTETRKGEKATRIGAGIGGGLEFTMLPKIDLEVYAKYNLTNLVGKKEDEKAINTLNIGASVLYSF